MLGFGRRKPRGATSENIAGLTPAEREMYDSWVAGRIEAGRFDSFMECSICEVVGRCVCGRRCFGRDDQDWQDVEFDNEYRNNAMLREHNHTIATSDDRGLRLRSKTDGDFERLKARREEIRKRKPEEYWLEYIRRKEEFWEAWVDRFSRFGGKQGV